jgi:Tfp pilus assembly protein PilN
VLAALPVFVLGEDPGELVAEVILLAFVALVGYRSARASSSRARSLLYVGGVVLAVAGVLVLKLLVGH